MKVLHKRDIEEILYGAAFLSTGAGGSLLTGLNMLNQLEKEMFIELNMLDAEEMQDNEYAALSLGFGSPDSFNDAQFGEEAVNAFEAYQDMMKEEGKELKYLYSLEYAGFNTFTPMYVAMKKGLALVDADCNAKAVPDLKTSLYTAKGGQTYPVVISNQKGDRLICYPKDRDDFAAYDAVLRQISLLYDNKIGISTGAVSRGELQEKTITGALSYAQKVGALILRGKAESTDLFQMLKDELPMFEICRGKVIRMHKKAEAAFNMGIIEIENSSDGKSYFVDFKNENFLVRDGEEVITTVPDNICTFSLDDYAPITNAEVKEGMRLMISVVKAPVQWHEDSKGFEIYKEVLEELGYNGHKVSMF